MSNSDLERYVRGELHWDPKIDDSAIAVSAYEGVVTLRGTLGSFREKRDARKDARRVYGVPGPTTTRRSALPGRLPASRA